MNTIFKDYLTVNKYSKPATKLKLIKGIVVHWVGNPNTTAKQNRDYFENRKDGKNGYGSAHEIIGLNGDIVICIPDSEIAYHSGSDNYVEGIQQKLSNYPNDCTYSIETCHTDWDGKYTTETFYSLVNRLAELCRLYKLDPSKDIYRHYDITGKECPKYFVKYQHQWDTMLKAVRHLT